MHSRTPLLPWLPVLLPVLLVLAPASCGSDGAVVNPDDLDPCRTEAGEPCFDGPDTQRSGALAVSERGIVAVPVDGGLEITLPVGWGGAAGAAATLDVRLLTLEGTLVSRFTGESALEPGERAVGLLLPTSEAIASTEYANHVLRWSVTAGTAQVGGRRSLFVASRPREVVLLGQREVLVGGATQYRLRVSDPLSGEAEAGARAVFFFEREAGEAGAAPARVELAQATTDAFGMLTANVAIPDGFPADRLAVEVTHPDGAVETIRSVISLRRAASLLVTTDKPLYQPGQTIHIRLLALRQPDLSPRGGEPATIEVSDGKGNKVFRAEVTTDGWGIAATTFELASQLNEGAFPVRVQMGETVSERTVTVERYVLPKFRATLATDRAYYRPGQAMSGRVDANYLFGRPVAGGTVEVTAQRFDVEFHTFQQLTGTTDDQGVYSFSLTMPSWFAGGVLEQNGALVILTVEVIDTAGQRVALQRSLPIAAGDLVVELVPESGSLVPGIENRVLVVTSDPLGAPVDARVTLRQGASSLEVSTAPGGIGSFRLDVPADSGAPTLSVSASTDDGRRYDGSATLAVGGAGAGFVLVRPDRSLYEVGETAHIQVLVPGSADLGTELPDRVYLDVIRGGQTALMTTVELDHGVGRVDLDIGPDLAGGLELFGYYLTARGEIVRDSRRVFARHASGLTVAIQAARDEYRPRETAAVSLAVSDARGVGRPSAVGVQIVDEAVFALMDFRPGLEKTFFQLEQELQQPRYEIHGQGFASLMEPPADATRAQAVADVLTARASGDRGYGVSVNTWTDANTRAATVAAAAIQRDTTAVLLPYLGRLVEAGYVKDKAGLESFLALASERGIFTDPWGSGYRVSLESYAFVVQSAGIDETVGTPDDLTVRIDAWQLPGGLGNLVGGWGRNDDCPNCDWAQPGAGDGGWMGGGDADAAAEASDTQPPQGGSDPAVTVRSWFPETLYVNPAVITDASGQATIEVPLADSITSWRVTALANTMSGEVGSALGEIRVFQPFFVDIDVPVRLTRHDEVALPVVVYNYMPTAQSVRLKVETTGAAGAWFDLLDDAERTLVVPPESVTGTRFRIRARAVGWQAFRVYGYGQDVADAVERRVEVVPNGRAVVVNFADRLGEGATHALSFPAEAIPGANGLLVKVYPGLMAQVVEGLDSILQMPYGCFEQTSSTTYPNVLVLNYLLQSETVTPEIELKARQYINTGYQRLLSYEVTGGGFEWFGQPPAHPILTAYGLMEFVDMARVHPVDPAVITRTAAWLAGLQRGDGSFHPVSGGIAEGAINNYRDSVLRNTAYIAWALAQAGGQAGAVGRAVGYVQANRAAESDLYTLALIANLLVAADPNSSAGRTLLDELAGRAQRADGKAWWTANTTTEMYGGGETANIETSALIAYAMLGAATHGDLVGEVIGYLASKKDALGNFSSTQATIQALRLMVRSLDTATDAARGTLDVLFDGARVGGLTVTALNADLLWQLDLSDRATTGEHTVELRYEGEGQLMYQVLGTHWIEGPRSGGPGSAPLEISVAYDRTTLEVDDSAVVEVTVVNTTAAAINMVLVDVGVPPGFDVMGDTLADDVANGNIQRFEITGRQVILYIGLIPAGGTFQVQYEVKARMPMRGESGEARAYPYYEPDRVGAAEPVSLDVTE